MKFVAIVLQTDTTDANGVVTHTVYDELNRPVVQHYRPPLQGNADTNVRSEYTYNAVGNRTQVQDANGHVTAFHYDALNRVTEKIDPLGHTWPSTYMPTTRWGTGWARASGSRAAPRHRPCS